MVRTDIPPWLVALDERKPYVEVLNGERLPDTASYDVLRGRLKGRVSAQLDAWAADRGIVTIRCRFYFRHEDGTWSSLVPVTSFMSLARFPEIRSTAPDLLPRIAPDIAVEVVSPNDPPALTTRKAHTYIEFGSFVVLVLEPEQRLVTLYRAGGVEERVGRGAWSLRPFDDLVLDWETIYRDVGIA